MSFERLKDLVVELALLATGVFALTYIVLEASADHHLKAVNFSTFPVMISAGIILLSAIKLTQTLTSILGLPTGTSNRSLLSLGERPRHTLVTMVRGNLKLITRFTGTVSLSVAYAFMLGNINFFVLTALFLLVMFWLYGLRHPIHTCLMAAASAAALYGLFVSFLHLPL